MGKMPMPLTGKSLTPNGDARATRKGRREKRGQEPFLGGGMVWGCFASMFSSLRSAGGWLRLGESLGSSSSRRGRGEAFGVPIRELAFPGGIKGGRGLGAFQIPKPNPLPARRNCRPFGALVLSALNPGAYAPPVRGPKGRPNAVGPPGLLNRSV